MMFKVAANLSFMFIDVPFLERFHIAKACGFSAVECGPDIYEVNITELVDIKEKTNIEVVLINSPNKNAALVDKEEEFKSDLQLAIKYALALNCSRIHLMAGSLSAPMDWSNSEWQQAHDIYLSNVAYAADKCSEDFYHAQRKDGNLTEFLTQNIDIIGHIQVAQIPGRHEPDLKGEINYPFMFQMLIQLGYSGWLGCEYYPRDKVDKGLSWAKEFF